MSTDTCTIDKSDLRALIAFTRLYCAQAMRMSFNYAADARESQMHLTPGYTAMVAADNTYIQGLLDFILRVESVLGPVNDK